MEARKALDKRILINEALIKTHAKPPGSSLDSLNVRVGKIYGRLARIDILLGFHHT